MQFQILVGSGQFMQSLAQQAIEAKHTLYVQAMTFEGDTAGEQLIDLMVNSPAHDKRLIIDSFSKVVVSDHFVFGPKYFSDKDFRAEIRNTRRLVQKAQNNGIQVKYVNPTGPLMLRYPLRNHKKMMVVDGAVSFLGGINFSDHNFDWHDMMIAVTDTELGAALHDDFLATWGGNNRSGKVAVKAGDLYLLNGRKSKRLYADLFQRIQKAKNRVSVISPYVSEPLLKILSQTASEGVEVEIISPEQNNKGLFHDYLVAKSADASFVLKHHPGMFHLKAILIDDQQLIFGSSNYDLISYYFEQEVVLVSKEQALVADFKEQVLTPMQEASSVYPIENQPSSKSKIVMSLLSGFCRIASRTILRPVS